MRSHHLLLITGILLASCTSAPVQPSADNSESSYGSIDSLGAGALSVTLITDTTSVDPALAIVKNSTSVKLSGSKSDMILVEEYEADGPATFATVEQSLLPDDVIGAWWNYYAGMGTLVAVRRDSNVLRIEKREFDEQSGCGDWQLLEAYQAQTSTAVTVVPMQVAVTDATQLFCTLD